MKKQILPISFLLFSLVGCATPEAKPQWKKDVFAMTAHFMPGSEEDSYHCYVADSWEVILSKVPEGKSNDFKYEEWGIDHSSLIPGDALAFENNAERIMFLTTNPMSLCIVGEVRSVEVLPCSLYEVTVKKEGESISFFCPSAPDLEIPLPEMKNDYCLMKAQSKIQRKALSAYEDGAKLYYSYNEALAKPLDYAYFFDYCPRQ